MRKLKLATIVGTRPEIIRLSEIIKKCDLYFDHTLIHTGQNYDYELNEIFFEGLSLRSPDVFLNCASENLGQAMGSILEKSYEAFSIGRFDALLVLGDTNSALSVISAKRLKIPIFHMEAGNRCFDENLPEEINRRIVDHTSDVNICYSEHARRNLLREGRPIERTFVSGSPMREVLSANEFNINNSDVLDRLGLKEKQFIVLSAHREENIDGDVNFAKLALSIDTLAEEYNLPIIYSLHPRSKKYVQKRGKQFHPLVNAMPPFGFADYVALQKNALCTVSDSGTLPEESAILKFPAVSIRTSTERPESMEKGNFVIGGISSENVLQSVRLAVESNDRGEYGSPVSDYEDDNISMKIVNIIQGYTGVVNEMVWRK
jgi:UDP-N-acetylglucosamine 2-epimerase (non-hydrolysing)